MLVPFIDQLFVPLRSMSSTISVPTTSFQPVSFMPCTFAKSSRKMVGSSTSPCSIVSTTCLRTTKTRSRPPCLA